MKIETLGKLQGLGLAALTRFASSDLPDQLNIRRWIEKSLYQGSKQGFRFSSKAASVFSTPTAATPKTRLAPGPRSGIFDLSLSEEQSMVKESLQRFASDILKPAAHDADASHCPPETILQQAAELGLMLYAVPETHGGIASNDTLTTQMIAFEALGYGDFGLALALLAPVSVANLLTRFGSDQQQSRYLKALAEDSALMASIACQEPWVGFNPQQLATQAVRTANGFVLTGEKSLVVMGQKADLLVVAAQLSGKPALFLVDTSSKGVYAAPEPAMGMKAAATARLRFEQVELSTDALLEADYQQFLDLGNLALCSTALGVCESTLEYVIGYVNERTAFGEPISHRQAVAFMVADMAIELDAMRMLVWRACARAEAGQSYHREAHLARILCQEKAMKIGTDAVQLLGGHGYTKEHPVERWYRDLRSLAIVQSPISF